MEQVLSGLANLGFGGLMAAAVVYIHLHTVKVVLPEMLAAFRAEQEAQRALHDRHITLLADRMERIEARIIDYPVTIEQLMRNGGKHESK